MRLALAALLLLIAPFAPAADTRKGCDIGNVARVSGEVKVVRAGTAVFPLAGEVFCVGDRFITGPRGVAELKFTDGTEISVGKDSAFVITKWRQRRLFANEASFELLAGAFRSLTGSMTQRRHTFEVKTRIATIGVRGTEFWGGMTFRPDELDVIMLNGKGVYVKNEAGEVEISAAGLGTTVRSGKAPSEPAAWAADKLQQAVRTITP